MGRKRDGIVRESDFQSEKYNSVCKIEMDQQKEDPPAKKMRISISISSSDVKEACVQLVTEENVPFQLFDSAPFKTLTAQIFNGLNMTPITSRNVMQHVSDKYELEKKLLIDRVKDKMLSLKIDIASRHARRILGVNVQFYENKVIEVKSLGVIELHRKHTGLNLSKEIENILGEFSIKKQQLYTITSDNGKDVLKAIECLNENPESALSSDIENEELMKDINIFSIKSIRCAAHSMQLAVKDFLNEDARDKIVSIARQLVKTLRTPRFRLTLSSTALPLPITDVPTRCSSTFEMLKSVCLYEDFIREHLPKNQQPTDKQWADIKVLLSVLEPISAATKKLQAEQLYFGDFYKLWLETKLLIKSMSTNIHSDDLANCLESREEELTNNEMVLSAIFLDPRIRRIILKNPIQLAAAKNHLVALTRKILALDKRNMQNKKFRVSSEASETSSIQLDDAPQQTSQRSTCSLLSEFLNLIEVDPEGENSEEEELAAIEIHGYSPRLIDINEDIMSYWENKKFQYPRLYRLAKVLHSVPATQVSVERAFSALKLVMTDLRWSDGNLSAESLKTIMFLKLNK